MSQDDVTQRLTEVIKIEKNLVAFAKKVNRGAGVTRNMLSRKTKPSFGFLYSIVEAYPNLNIRWLVSGQGKMWESEKNIIAGDGNKTQLGSGHIMQDSNNEYKYKWEGAQREIELLKKIIEDKEALINMLQKGE